MQVRNRDARAPRRGRAAAPPPCRPGRRAPGRRAAVPRSTRRRARSRAVQQRRRVPEVRFAQLASPARTRLPVGEVFGRHRAERLHRFRDPSVARRAARVPRAARDSAGLSASARVERLPRLELAVRSGEHGAEPAVQVGPVLRPDQAQRALRLREVSSARAAAATSDSGPRRWSAARRRCVWERNAEPEHGPAYCWFATWRNASRGDSWVRFRRFMTPGLSAARRPACALNRPVSGRPRPRGRRPLRGARA